jgi:hypothetical protein
MLQRDICIYLHIVQLINCCRYKLVHIGLSLSLTVSPSAAIVYVRYWFRLSRYVYGGNRSFAPILRQSRCSLMCDVY